MREIRFRQWNSRVKTFQYNIGAAPESDGVWTSPCYVNWNRYPLTQFTGLHDKNGKEVWEGDLLRYTTKTCVPPIVVILEVVFEEGAFRQRNNDRVPDIWFDWDELEVIGNIYETPDSIKEN